MATAKCHGTSSEAYIIRQILPGCMGNFSSSQPGGLPCWVISLAFSLIGYVPVPPPSKRSVPLYHKSKAQTRHVFTI
jgi:hypothetical protein